MNPELLHRLIHLFVVVRQTWLKCSTNKAISSDRIELKVREINWGKLRTENKRFDSSVAMDPWRQHFLLDAFPVKLSEEVQSKLRLIQKKFFAWSIFDESFRNPWKHLIYFGFCRESKNDKALVLHFTLFLSGHGSVKIPSHVLRFLSNVLLQSAWTKRVTVTTINNSLLWDS